MAWALVVALAVVGAWWYWQRAGAPRITGPADRDVAPPQQGGARPLARVSAETTLDTRTLLAAFRSDELPVSGDVERDDHAMLIRLLKFVAEYCGAREAVLWEPHEGEGGMLIAAAWSMGNEPPALTESERLILELAATEQRSAFNPGGPGLRVAAAGVPVSGGRGAVSVHFREDPPFERGDVLQRLERLAREVADRHELLRTRALLAVRNNRLRKMIRAAITLQGSLDPIALEEVLVRDACVVAGAEWGVLVRGSSPSELPAIVRVSEGAPVDFRAGLTARQGTIVGEVYRTGHARVVGDTRPLIADREELFDATPLPSGTRSLAVVPVRRSERAVSIGVLVLGKSARNGFVNSDSHSAADLGTIAAGALDTAWAWQDATLSAKTDQLTGLPNRRAFDEEFQRMVSETDRYGNESALVIVDVDHFKQVNDTYGHDAGDQVLKAVGATLLQMKRTTDKVARLGGEELAVLLPQTDRTGALEAAERCRKAIESLSVRTGVGTVKVTASFGVAMYAARSGASGSLFDRADQALYAAKHGGRNRVVLAPD